MLQSEHLKAAFTYHNIIYHIYCLYNDFFFFFLSLSGRIISAILWTLVCRRSPRTDLPLMCCSRYKASKELFDVAHESGQRHAIISLLESISLIMHEEIWSVNIVQENNVLPFLYLLQLDATSCAIIVSLYICCYSWLKRVLTLQAGQLIAVEIICWALELQRQISKGNGEWGFNVRVSVWSSGSRQSSWVDVQLQWCFRNWISVKTHRNPWWLPYFFI